MEEQKKYGYIFIGTIVGIGIVLLIINVFGEDDKTSSQQLRDCQFACEDTYAKGYTESWLTECKDSCLNKYLIEK